MDASRSLSATPIGVPSGAWRWAAIAFGLLAFAAAVIAVVMPQTGVAGFAVLIGIALISLFLIYAIWPRGSRAIGAVWRRPNRCCAFVRCRRSAIGATCD